MERFEKGMLVKSKAGHDAGMIYMILDMDDTYLYLVDGRIRTKAKPKKKRFRHVQIIKRVYDIEAADDTQIKRILKEYNKEEEI